MKDSRLARGTFLLWAIAYVPSMLCVVLLALAVSSAVVQVWGYVSSRGFLSPLVLICIAFFIVDAVFYATVFRKRSLRPWTLYVQALATTLVLTQLFTVLICLIPFPVLAGIAAVVLLAVLLAFIAAAFVRWMKFVRRYCALQDSYPHNRGMLIKIIHEVACRFGELSPRRPSWKTVFLQLPDDFAKAAYLKSVELLPYEQNEQILAEVAKSAPFPKARMAALQKLPYPEERETLAAVALGRDRAEDERLAALKKLPYPEERETLAAVALDRDRAEDERLAALQKLPASETEVFNAVIAELEQSVLEISGCIIPYAGSKLCVKARMLKQLYRMFSSTDRLQVADRPECNHADYADHEDWLDIPLCVGGTHEDSGDVHSDVMATTWYRDFTIAEDPQKS